MKKFYSILPLGLLVLITFSNLEGQECADYKYVAAVLEVETSPEIHDKIKQVFKRDLKGRNKRKSRVNFTISNRIDYLPLYFRFDNVLDSTFTLNNQLLNGDDQFKEKYDAQEKFNSYNSECLNQLIPQKDSFLELRFSKPKETYLIAELLDKRINHGKIKYGKAIQFLFLFDSSGLILKVYSTACIYN